MIIIVNINNIINEKRADDDKTNINNKLNRLSN